MIGNERRGVLRVLYSTLRDTIEFYQLALITALIGSSAVADHNTVLRYRLLVVSPRVQVKCFAYR